jgi:hypothetical protein
MQVRKEKSQKVMKNDYKEKNEEYKDYEKISISRTCKHRNRLR